MPLFRKASAGAEQRKRIYSEDEIKQRLETMSPDMQNTFIRMAESLLHKESQMFLDIVAQSRKDILDVGQSIKDEQDVLKTTARFLAKERNGESSEYADDDDPDKTKIHFESEYNKKAVADYLKAVGREKPSKSQELQKRRNYRLKNDAAFIPEYARRIGTFSAEDRPSTANSSRPGTAYRMRMLADEAAASGSDHNAGAVGGSSTTVREVKEATLVDEKVKEEKEELMEHMKRMDSALNDEKERQQQAIKARKEARRAKKEAKKTEEQNKAMELLEGNQEAEEQKRKNKERQEQILKERLAKKKLERRKTLLDLEVDDAVDSSHPTAEEKARDFEQDIGITRAKTDVDPAQAAAAEEKKKGKKKKKQQQQEEVPQPVEAKWDVNEPDETAAAVEQKKPKKKKKTKSVAEDPAAAGEAAAPEVVEEKKKKKKKKKEEAPDTVLDLEEPVAEAPVTVEKKKKKKKLDNLDMSVSEV